MKAAESGSGVASGSPWFASLPWYDFEELRPATDRLWSRIASALSDAGVAGLPTSLDRSTCYLEQWGSGRFLFGQACGYDVRVSTPDQLQIVATPCYTAPGCSGAKCP